MNNLIFKEICQLFSVSLVVQFSVFDFMSCICEFINFIKYTHTKVFDFVVMMKTQKFYLVQKLFVPRLAIVFIKVLNVSSVLAKALFRRTHWLVNNPHISQNRGIYPLI